MGGGPRGFPPGAGAGIRCRLRPSVGASPGPGRLEAVGDLPMIRAWIRNPWEAAAVAALAAAGAFVPTALAAAALLFAALEISAGARGLEGPRWWPSLWPRTDLRLTILYDATCALCARSKAQLEKWPTAGSMRFLPL